MAKTKRNTAQREADLIRISELFLEGRSVREIAAVLSGEREYSLSHTQIGYDLKKLRKLWQAEHTDNMDAALAQELARLAKVETEAWAAWRRSQEDAVVVVDEDRDCGENPGTVHREQRTGQCGDPRFLAQVERCIEQRAKLLGLNDHVIRLRLDSIERLLTDVDETTA